MKKALVVVDMQNDFIDGSLGTKEAQIIVGNAVKTIESNAYDKIFVTLDTHETDYSETLEGKYLPVSHCIRNTDGWKLNIQIQQALKDRNFQIIEKPTFGSCALVQQMSAYQPDEITLIGLCTDICVISNALLLRAAFYNTEIKVIAEACAGVTPEKHEAALKVMESNQIQVC